MAEGVKIPEKKAGFWRFGPPIGGRGLLAGKEVAVNPDKSGHENGLHDASPHTGFFTYAG
jgi:hypothetical protein